MATVKDSSTPRQTALAAVSALAIVAICGLPYVRWFAHPSLFDDDFLRVGSLRRSNLGDALFRPFNEHMAPLFETVSWLAWRGAGRDIRVVPLAFQIASFVAFGATVGLLGLLLLRELRSRTAALIGVVVFCLSAVSAETVLWFSASSFQWAASAMLAAWLFAAIGDESRTWPGRTGWFSLSLLSALCSPAFSAIGLLAGPMASIRILAKSDNPRPILRRLRWSILPCLGTAFYLLICEQFQYRQLVSDSIQHNFSPGAAILATIKAPSAVLIPGLVGLPSLARDVPGWALAGISPIGLVVVAVWARRGRAQPLVLGGITLIAMGYILAYASRARPGDDSVFEIGRYHLFPQIGLVWLIGAMLATRLRSIDKRPGSSLFAVGCLAAVLAIPQYPRMQAVSDRMLRYPEQARILQATAHLEEICEREGITLDQATSALEPIQTPWFQRPWPFNPLLNLFSTGPTVARVPDSRVRSTLIEAISNEEREALFGGMEATRYRTPASSFESAGPPVDAIAVVSPRVKPVGQGTYRVEGWPGQIDFEVGPEADRARAVCLPGLRLSRPIQIWWSDADGTWSATRSVWWKPDRDHPREDWGVALDRLPHWQRGHVRRLRLILRDSSPVEVNAPRFLP